MAIEDRDTLIKDLAARVAPFLIATIRNAQKQKKRPSVFELAGDAILWEDTVDSGEDTVDSVPVQDEKD